MEMELINDIVKDIYKRIGLPLGTTLPQLIGVKYDIECDRITSWLEDGSKHTADILTIWGMSGIGKTSLADYIYKLHHHGYTSTFVRDINRRCGLKYHGLLEVQKQLFDSISRRSSFQVHDVSAYTSMIEKALVKKKVLLVLDDVDSPDQLDALLGNRGLHPGSKIIITTKDASLTERCVLFNPQVQPQHTKVLLSGLYESESLKLLCTHAFESQQPKEGYEDVLKKLVKYCKGHPLAIKVLGRSLRTRDVAYWEGCINGLKKEPDSSIKEALQTSFNSLPSKNDKELFKYIACFFVGEDIDLTEIVLDACDINTKTGITNLIDRCLLSIGCNNELMMHTLIQVMGRDLVRQEAPEEPCRLWCNEESFKVLEQLKSTKKLIGLALDMGMLEKEKLSGSLWVETKALSRMENLKLLQLNYVKMRGSYKNLPKELKWLCMHGFHLKSIPSELPVENLVALDMSHSNITSFDMSYSKSQRVVNRLKGLIGSSSVEKRLLGSLKILDLRFCEQLRSIGGFFQLPLLERLIISNCTSLIQVSESIGHCVELVFIDLSNCRKLKTFPRTIGKLTKVKTLLSNGCDNLVFPTEMRDMDSLQTLSADRVGIHSQTSSSAIVDVIPREMSSFMSSLPISILVNLSLKNNNLSTESFPMEFSRLSVLKNLYLDGNPIVSMPSCLSSLPCLEELGMVCCTTLETVEHPPISLRKLALTADLKVKKIIFYPEMSPLNLQIGLSRLPDFSFVVDGMIKIQPLAHVEDEVLRSLGWTDMDVIKHQPMMTPACEIHKSTTQMYYEFGIFSSIYAGTKMPDNISCRSTGSSVSFTIPSSLNKLRGLNVCCVLRSLLHRRGYNITVPIIVISNITKNRTWIYRQFSKSFKVVEYARVIFLSHWMFGKNEMEDGDQLTISIANLFENDANNSIKECGVGLVYDDGRMKEDALSYYKSWNHIIGGDLVAFQTTTGEYLLLHPFFFRPLEIFPQFQPFLAETAHTKLGTAGRISFRAFSKQMPNLVSDQNLKDHSKFHKTLASDVKVETQCSKISRRSELGEYYSESNNPSFIPDLTEDFTPTRPTRKGKKKLDPSSS